MHAVGTQQTFECMNEKHSNFKNFLNFVRLRCTACGTLVPRPGSEPASSAVKVQSQPLNHQGIP